MRPEIIDELNSSLNLQIKQDWGDLRPLDAVVMRHFPDLILIGFLRL